MLVPAVHPQTSHNHLFPSHHLACAAPSNFPAFKAHNCRIRKAFPIDGIPLRSAPPPRHCWNDSTCNSPDRLQFCQSRPVKHQRRAVTRPTCEWAATQEGNKKSRKTPPSHILTKDQHQDRRWTWSDAEICHGRAWLWTLCPGFGPIFHFQSDYATSPPTSCGHSGTVKADVASWVASEGRRRSPRGEWEADISGTLDVMEMGNWTTGCTRCLG